MGFLEEIAGIAVKGVFGYATSASGVKAAAETLARAEAQDGWISAEEFLDAYDVGVICQIKYGIRKDIDSCTTGY